MLRWTIEREQAAIVDEMQLELAQELLVALARTYRFPAIRAAVAFVALVAEIDGASQLEFPAPRRGNLHHPPSQPRQRLLSLWGEPVAVLDGGDGGVKRGNAVAKGCVGLG